MVTGKTSHFACAANFLRGRKCIFCGSFRVLRTARGYVKSGIAARVEVSPGSRVRSKS